MKLLLLLFIFSLNLNASNYEFEEIPIDLKVNNLKTDDFIIGYFISNNSSPFISIDDLLNDLSITQFTIDKQSLVYQLNGDVVKAELEIILYHDKHLISLNGLKKKFNNVDIQWDISKMKLIVYTSTQFPLEFERKQSKSREKIKQNKAKSQYLYLGKMHFFTPGILNIHYSKNNIYTTTTNYLSLQTTNQILYGKFEQSTSINDGNIVLNDFLWSREFYENRKISIGNQYRDIPFNINKDSSYMGLKIYNQNSWGGTGLEIKKHSIEGRVQDGLMVELYRNGILKDYQISKFSKFKFFVPSTDGNNIYEIWIYKNNGVIEKQKISLHNDQKILMEKTFDYAIELGQGEKDKKFNPYNFNLRYGLTNNISLGIETYNVENKKSKIKNFNNYSLVYQDLYFDFITNRFEVNYSANIEDKSENLYRLELNSDTKIFNNTFGYENYKNLKDRLKRIYDHINFNLFSTTILLGFERSITTINESCDNYEVNLIKNLLNNFVRVDSNYSKRYYLKKDSSQNIGIRLSHDFNNRSLKKYIDTLTIGYKTNLSKHNCNCYELMFGRSKLKNSNFQYYASIRMNQKENRVGITCNYLFGDKIFTTSSSQWKPKSKKKVSTSIGINAKIDFNTSNFLINPKEYGDSGINGVAYVDTNDNGVYDLNDEVVEGLMFGSRCKIKSGEDGRFYIPNILSLSSQKLELKLDNEEYISGYSAEGNINYITFPGESLKINIPIKKVITIVGNMEFSDEFYLEDVEKFIDENKIYITNIKTKKVIAINLKDEFFIQELTQGEYSIQIKNGGIKMKRVYLHIFLFLTIFIDEIGAPSVYPSTVKMDLSNGRNHSTVTIFNTGDKTMKYKLGINLLDNLGNKSKLAPYLKVFPRFIEIEAGESQIVKVIAKGIPIDKFKNGEYRGALSIEELGSSIQKKYRTKHEANGFSSVINLKYIINMAIYGYFGELIPKLKISNIKIDEKEISGVLENNGNYSYFIKYQILDKSGRVLDEGTLLKILYGQKEKFSIKNVKNGTKIIFLEKNKNIIL